MLGLQLCSPPVCLARMAALVEAAALQCGPVTAFWHTMYAATLPYQCCDCSSVSPLDALHKAQHSTALSLPLLCGCDLSMCPPQLSRLSPLHEDFFCGEAGEQLSKQQAAKQKTIKKGRKGQGASGDTLLIHAGPLKATPSAKPLQALLLERTVLDEREVGCVGWRWCSQQVACHTTFDAPCRH